MVFLIFFNKNGLYVLEYFLNIWWLLDFVKYLYIENLDIFWEWFNELRMIKGMFFNLIYM